MIENKKKELKETSDKIYDMRDEIQSLSKKLREKREHEKAVRLANSRIDTRLKTIQIDSVKRPSDREYGVRPYSKMDNDVWKYDQLRDWFNTYAPKETIQEHQSPSQTGYTIRIE